MSQTREDLDNMLKALKSNRFDARYAESSSAARQMVLEMIPQDSVVGVGDSVTVRQLGILSALQDRGTRVINPFTRELQMNPANLPAIEATSRKTLGTDVYLTGTNAVTTDGKLVNIDRGGNRVAGMVFGAKKVILVIGRNKIVKDVEEGLHRIKHVITPALAKRRGRQTPCAITGECGDCRGLDRFCNVTVILEKRPLLTDLTIVLVNEDLGVGWDPAWPGERIQRMMDRYQQFSWAYSLQVPRDEVKTS